MDQQGGAAESRCETARVNELLVPNQPVAAADVAVASDPIEPRLVDGGAPSAGATPLAELGGVEVGVWEMTTGTARDTEIDEVFVVITGRASVSVAGGPTFDIGAGDIVRLRAGDETSWTVHEPLRKVYVALG
jgi:uncharacterized cupin superfamily protein